MTDNNEVRGSKTMSAKPVAWITDTESADMHGWISCKAWSDGEFTTPLVLASDYAAIVAERDALRVVEARGVMLTMALRAAVTALAHASESDPIYLRTYEHASNSLRDYAIDAALAAEGRDG